MKQVFVYTSKYCWIFIPLLIIFFDKAYTFVNTVELTLEADVTIHNQQEELVSELFYYTDSGYNHNHKAVFSYENHEKGTIYPLTISIPDAYLAREIRLDPVYNGTAVFTIHKVFLRKGFYHKTLSLDKLYRTNNIIAQQAIEKIQFEKEKIIIYTDGVDPVLQIISNLSSFTGTKAHIFFPLLISLVLSIVCSPIFRFLLAKTGVLRGVHFLFEKTIPRLRNLSKQSILVTFFSLVLAITLTKTFISLVAIYRFQRTLSIKDFYFTYALDLGLVFIVGAIIAFIAYLARIVNSKAFHNILISIVLRSTVIIQKLLYLLLISISVSLVILVGFYLLSAYIFFEWGAFIEPQHLEALKFHGGGKAEFIDLLLRWRTLLFLFAIAALFFFSHKASRHLRQYHLRNYVLLLLILLLPICISAWFPYKHFYNFKPSVQSPVLTILGKEPEYSEGEGVPASLLDTIKTTEFTEEKQGAIAKEYLPYQGIAKDMNVIIMVLESVRKKNVNIYGYKRKTMPFLSQIAENSLVFHNAFVTQPRSCKTMASLLLGTYPDPRTQAISWRTDILNANADNNLLNILINQNYRFYYGTVQEDYGNDKFYPFMQKLSDNRIDRAMSMETFIAQKLSSNSKPDERDLVRDLTRWTAQQENNFFAMIWTNHAHMPYDSPIEPFGVKTTVDKYDNNLALLDDSIRILTSELEKQGKLDNTLIVILGDHGEAVGEMENVDFGHGNYLYDYSLRVPFVIYNPELFPQRIDLRQRFQPKDIPGTLLYLLGVPGQLGQSINIFSKSDTDKIYLSNIYTDYKLGMIFDQYKFVYRPKYGLTYLFDLQVDPDERDNIIHNRPADQIDIWKTETLRWYKYQIQYLNQNYFSQDSN